MTPSHLRVATGPFVLQPLIIAFLCCTAGPVRAAATTTGTTPPVRTLAAPAIASTGTGVEPKQGRWKPSTMAWQTLGGLTGGVVGALTGVGFALVAAKGLEGPTESGELPGSGEMYLVLTGAAIGGLLGMSLGTWTAGELAGADGRLGWTLVGTAVGGISGGLVGGLLETKNGASIAVIGLAAVGGILGYQLTLDASAPSPISAVLRVGSDGRMHVGIPIVAPYRSPNGTDRGWQLSLISGRF